MPKTEQKIEAEITVSMSTIQEFMNEFLWNRANEAVGGVISHEEYEIVESKPCSITLKVTGYIVGE